MTPEELQTELRRASELIDLGRPDQALELLGRLLAAEPGAAAPIQMLMAVAHLNAHRPGEAARHGEASVQADPEFAAGYNILGNAYQFTGRHLDAVRTLQRGLQLDPTMVSAYTVGAQALSDLKHPQDAEQWARTAIQLDPEDADGQFALGYVLHDERTAEAADAYRAALELDPHHMQALQNLATLSVRGGDRRAGTQMMADVLAGTRGSQFTLAILDVLVTQFTLRAHRVTFFTVFLTNMAVAAVAANTAPNPWPATLLGVLMLGAGAGLCWGVNRSDLAALREYLPRQGSGFFRAYPRRNPVAAVWLGLVLLAWLLLVLGMIAAVVGAFAGTPNAPFFLVAPGGLTLLLMVVGAILSWVQAALSNRRLKRTRLL
ncbi:tetratricopeptide repeat protein [Propioniciclava coleopterorum]|uniref:Tetratricopeptide repeat protein n=1 Tax=Propioniciclava coleopterorum TaxID=2714937 RepID=A0A6G7Y9Z2_9ACTN|nr:tetratricopeptide repeat protein [Propioniciclava coleopterorum]QIK73613.1 tetratricopeptide repeat protein [Propioniciclava coleopterorum]